MSPMTSEPPLMGRIPRRNAKALLHQPRKRIDINGVHVDKTMNCNGLIKVPVDLRSAGS
jgi:hypothetical protein